MSDDGRNLFISILMLVACGEAVLIGATMSVVPEARDLRVQNAGLRAEVVALREKNAHHIHEMLECKSVLESAVRTIRLVNAQNDRLVEISEECVGRLR